MRKYIRKSDRQSWNVSSMNKAVQDVLNKKISQTVASALYQVPYTTLARKVEKIKKNSLLDVKEVCEKGKESNFELFL